MTIDLPRVAELVTHALACGVAFARTRPGRATFSPALRPLLWFLGMTLVADVFRMGLQRWVLQMAPRPFEGFARCIFHLDQAGVVGWNAGLVMVAALAFVDQVERSKRGIVPIVFAACAAWGQLIGGYPTIRGERLEQVYFGLELVTVAACVGLAVQAWQRDRWFGLAARAVSVLVAAEAATLLGPYLGEPFNYWATANVISACAYLVLVWELRRSRHVAA